jgi:hypothetical protein
MEDYQKQVDKMHRLMEETRQVSDARIRALTAEVEDLRPENERLKSEVEALRRHLGLVVDELRNPIIIPEELRTTGDVDPYTLQPELLEHDRSFGDADSAVDFLEHENAPPLSPKFSEEEHDSWAWELQNHADEMLKELEFFKHKVKEDRSRFPILKQVAAI